MLACHELACVSEMCVHVGLQAALVGFYRRFLESPNFSAWFERQRGAAWGWQAAEWATAAAVRGEGADLRGMDEVQIVEAFFELERTLEAATAAARLPKAPAQARRIHPRVM